MCFSAEVSIASYIVGSLASLYLLIYGNKVDKHIAIFSLTFIQMQLAEFFMWIDQNCGYINHYASVFAKLILILQPLSIVIGAILFKTTIIPNNILYIFALFWIIAVILYINNIFNYKKKLCSKSIDNNYLEWDEIEPITDYGYILYFSFMFLLWLFMKDFKGILIFILGIISILLSLNNNLKFDFPQWESKWCFMAVSLPFIMIIYNFINK